jgi:Na+/pantothenate symporter
MIEENPVSTIANTLTHTLEALLVLLGTFVLALTIMSTFGGLSALELRLALIESVAAVVVWSKYLQRPV